MQAHKLLIKKVLFTLLTVMTVVSFLGNSLVSAASSDTLQSILDNTPYYAPGTGSCGLTDGPVGSGPIFGLEFPEVSDAQALATSINTFIANTDPDSPFINMGQYFVQAGQQYDVNPAMMVGIASKESSLGTNTVTGSYDAFGLTADGDISNMPYMDGITFLPSWQASISLEAQYISNTYIISGAPYPSSTVYELITHYTPDDPGEQTAITLDVMHKILDGLSTTVSGQTDSDADSPTSGCSAPQGSSSTTYIPSQNGYSLSGANAMAHFYQCTLLDGKTIAPWNTVEYGQAGTVCAGGCGITSMAMVVDTLTGATETPGTMAVKYAAFGSTGGTTWGLWPAAAKDFGLTYTDLGTNFDAAANIIQQGGLVIVSVYSGYFTGDSHLMVIRAIDNQGNFYLADPNAPGNTERGDPTETIGFSTSFMENTALGHATQLFAFTKG
jgi:hypothetical protein